jgi:hypothetical protein
MRVKSEWSFDPSPCELCPHVRLCGTGLACEAFAMFAVHGGRRWRSEAHEPSAIIYQRIFAET